MMDDGVVGLVMGWIVRLFVRGVVGLFVQSFGWMLWVRDSTTLELARIALSAASTRRLCWTQAHTPSRFSHGETAG